jgi:uncharacterized protein (DUF433 family)
MLQSVNWQDYIVTEPKILVGKPVIKGTRISIEFLLGLLSKGWTEKQIMEEYPSVTQEGLQALFSYLQEYFKEEYHFKFPTGQKKMKTRFRTRRTKETKKR